MPVSLNTNITNVTTHKTLPAPETKKEDVKESHKTPTKTKVLVGSGLAALAAIGIYIATRKKVPTNAQSKVQDIIKEGISPDGTQYKTIIDKKTGNWKENIYYNANGKERFHDWYDSTMQNFDINKSVTKKIQYYENGDIEQVTTYMSPGKKAKYVKYCTSETKKEYGQNIVLGMKYYPNGKKRFEMVQHPAFDIGTAKLYDENGNLIKEKTFVTKKGMKNNFDLSILEE